VTSWWYGKSTGSADPRWTRYRRRRTWTRGIHIVITTLGVDLKTPAGRLVFGMMAQIAEFERELIRERVTAGMADAKKRGVHTCRKHTLTPHQRAEAVRMHVDGKTLAEIAALFRCGRTVIHRAINGEAPRAA
jgi:DNA invertase Pin-like site-specific DNA recombinase